MAEASGRDLLLKIDTGGGYTTVASIQSKSISINNEPIDITTDDSDAWRTLLAEPGARSIDLSFSGILKDDELLALISAGTSSIALQDIQLTYPDTATHTGDFFLNSYSITGEYNGAVTFEGSLQSTGEIVYAGAP